MGGKLAEALKNVRRRPRDGRPAVAFISWSFVRGRSHEIAESLGGESKSVFYSWTVGRTKWLVVLRYAISSIHTLGYLVRRRPRSVIVTLPPVFPGLVTFLYCWLARAPFVLDSHPSGFGRKGDRVSERLLPVHRWLSRRAAATMVTTDEWVHVVDRWGGTGIVVHEAPGFPAVDPPPESRAPFVVLLVAVFSGDESVQEAIDAVRGFDDVVLRVTGDRRRADPTLIRDAPPNVEFIGFLGPEEYRQAIEAAHVILALTTEPTSVMRAACEAVYAGRPLIASDWPRIAELFREAVLVANTTDGIRAGIVEAHGSYDTLLERTDRAHASQMTRWIEQQARLASSLGIEASP